MARLSLLAVALLLAGCAKTGISSAEQQEQSKNWGQDAYEKAMIEAGREDELKAEKEKWAQSQQGGDQGQEQSQP
jgi:hypothetical protein